jgi:hypothetical protein
VLENVEQGLSWSDLGFKRIYLLLVQAGRKTYWEGKIEAVRVQL